MPLIRNNTLGAELISTAHVSRRFRFSIASGTSTVQADAQLQVNNLNSCTFYAFLSGGPVGCVVQPFFAADNTTGGTSGVPNWFPVTDIQPLQLNIPFLMTIKLITNMISIVVGVPALGIPATVDVIISAGA